jgi:hypothetical protein
MVTSSFADTSSDATIPPSPTIIVMRLVFFHGTTPLYYNGLSWRNIEINEYMGPVNLIHSAEFTLDNLKARMEGK